MLNYIKRLHLYNIAYQRRDYSKIVNPNNVLTAQDLARGVSNAQPPARLR
jgi:hypothetical protein